MLVAVVPAFNEEKTIGSVVRSLFSQVDKVIVVDDFSGDDTLKMAVEAGASVLHHEINCGQGAALQTGHELAVQLGADYVVDFDADEQFDVEDIKPAVLAMQKAGADFLFGSRFLGEKLPMPLSKRYIMLPLARMVNRLFAGIKLTDGHNGFRILGRQALEKIIITQDRMAHNTEIPAQIKKYNLKYLEFPIKVVYREYGQGILGGLKVLGDLIMGKFVK